MTEPIAISGQGSARESTRRSAAASCTLALLLVGIASIAPARSQDVQLPPTDRPKIGLALGGGGAKGGAHVGVLEVLEELNIPIDYIAGTSIGAIVGGLYASGMSSAELRETMVAVDWDEVLNDEPPRRNLTFRRKEEDARYLFDFEVGIGRDGLRWPGGLLGSQNLFFLLQALTLPVAHIDDFDELPIPFHAVATDIDTGEVVVLDRGPIAPAIRASMALPAIFAPVELDGRLLVDGGLVRNLPVDVVREMGADIVIAVDLGIPLSSREVERSVIGIFEQTRGMLTRPNVETQIGAADLVLAPAVADIGTLAFDPMEPVVDRGVEEARAHAEELQRFSVDPEVYARHRARQQRTDPTERLTVAWIELEGNRRVDDRIVEEQIRLEPGQEMTLTVRADDVERLFRTRTRGEIRRRQRGEEEVDLVALSDDLRRLYGLGDFESVDFRLEERADDDGVVIEMKEKPWGPNFLHLGLGITSDADGETGLELLLNLTRTRINARGGEWRTDLLLGEDRSIFTELYQPLDFRGDFFVAPRVSYERRRQQAFEGGTSIAELDIDLFTAGVDLGYQLDIFGELRLGVVRSTVDVGVGTGQLPVDVFTETDLESIDVGGLRFQAVFDRLDSVTFPRRGSLGQLSAFSGLEALGSDDEYTKLEARSLRFWTRGRHTGFAGFRAGWSPGGELPIYDQFALGGFGSLSGFVDNELQGQYLGVARIGYYQERWKKWYLGGWLEAGNVWQTSDEADFDNLIYAATVLIGRDTAIGPLYVAWGQAEEGRNKVYLVLGRTL